MLSLLLAAHIHFSQIAAATFDDDADAVARAGRLILAEEKKSNGAYAWLRELCDDIGNRISGSENAAKAVKWGREAMKRAGADRADLIDVSVPKWVRGDIEEATVLEPTRHDLAVLALGGSIATPPQGITGEVIVVRTFDELKARASEASGKIVLFNRAMGEMSADGKRKLGYGDVVPQRTNGAIEAAKVGAIASVIRSVGTRGGEYRLPHTGMMKYEDGVKQIPHAALSAEDADLIARLIERHGKVVLNLKLSCSSEGMVPSANVVGEIRGRERPDEVIVVGGHLDSWDVGQGAHDDGVGVAASIEVIRLLKALDLRPRRTVRAVLFMNEENGLAGGTGYAKHHERDMAKHVAAIEMDGGAFGFEGFGISAGDGGLARVKALVGPALESLGTVGFTDGGGGADIGPMRKFGVPQIGVDSDGETYFKYHHTQADTLDKVDPAELGRHAAALAVLVYALAEMDEPLPRLPPPDDAKR